MKRLSIITSDHRRHRWVASRLAQAGELVAIVAESKPATNPSSSASPDPEVAAYFRERDESEVHWFADAPADFSKLDAPVQRVDWGGGNNERVFSFLSELHPDLVFLFGSSIIKNPLLEHFGGCIINMHLGLSPYYRGSSTNFWPLVDGLPECVGVTIHHATLKVDGGNILLQARPDAVATDNSHDLGCKTILAGVELLQKIISYDGHLPAGTPQVKSGKLCRRSDFTLDAMHRMLDNFAAGMMPQYMADKSARDACYPIVDTI